MKKPHKSIFGKDLKDSAKTAVVINGYGEEREIEK